MKRLIAIFLALLTIFSAAFGLTGCSSETANTISMGQWLMLINDSFGMTSYTSQEPYFANVDSSSPYFATVQTAAEWEVITGDSINLDETITWKQAVVTLVNASGFAPIDASDSEKFKCGIDNFDNTIRNYWENRKISANDAVELLAAAQKKWSTRKYTERVERVEYHDNVVNMASDENKSEIVSANSEAIVVKGVGKDIEKDDICVIPNTENDKEFSYVKVAEVREEDGKTIITPSTEEVKIEDVYEEIYIEETLVPTAENTVIYDANGNVISDNANLVLKGDGEEADTLLLTNVDKMVSPAEREATVNDSALPLASASVSKTFKVGDDVEVSLSYNLNGKLDFEAGVEYSPNDHLKLSASAAVNDLEVTQKFDMKTEWKGIIPVPKLKSAELKVDYSVEQKYGLEVSAEKKGVAAPKYSNGNGKFLTNFKRAIIKDADGKGAKTIASKKEIKICSLNVYSAGVAKICLDVRLKISVEGSIEITISESGSKGVEYKNGNLRFIKDQTNSVEAEVKAKVEATLSFGPALYVVGLKKKLVGVDVTVGVGAAGTLTAKLADVEMHLIEDANFDGVLPAEAEGIAGLRISADAADLKVVAESQGGVYNVEAGVEVDLHIDWCLDISVYGILKVGVSDEAYLVDFIGDKVSLSIDILNAKNATFFNYHVDNWKWAEGVMTWGKAASGDNCTLEYVPFDQEAEEEPEEEKTDDTSSDNGSVSVGEVLLLSDMSVNLDVGGSYKVTVTSLPEGYSASDVVFSSDDQSVVTVDQNGNIKAVGEGVSAVHAKTPDGKYSALVAVRVSAEKVDFEGLD